jgi:C-terminal processing protease CtpA/Prc
MTAAVRWSGFALAALLVGSAAPGGAGRAWAKDEAGSYAKDLEFLLDELPKKARGLLVDKKIDWAKSTKDLRAEAKKVKDDAAYARLVNRILARLRDGHAAVTDVSPQLEASLKASREAEAKGRRWTGPRVHLAPSGDKVLVVEAFGDAAKQGVKVGMEVVTVEGQAARTWLEKRAAEMKDEDSYSTDHAALHAAGHWGLATWEGTPISFELLEGRDRKKVTVTRNGGPNYAPAGPVHPPADLKSVGRTSYGKTAAGFGYIHLRDVPDKLPEQIDEALGAIGDVPGLVLDMRANGGGGCDHEAVFGRFVAAGKKWRQYTSQGAKPFGGPMVVIVDAGVRSAGETVAGQFKEDGRALMIGPEPTAGMSSQKEPLEVPSKRITVRVSVASNKGRFNGGRGIEGIGVAPHEVVPYDGAELLKGVDTQIRRAEELLKDGFPKGAVPYEPPK